MWYPWVKQSPISEVQNCKHCDQPQPVEQGRIIQCQCPGAVQEAHVERQRIQNFQREQEAKRNGGR